MQIPHLPSPVCAQLDRITALVRHFFGSDLVGLYLHGSICLDQYVPEVSDLDLMIATHSRMDVDARVRFALSLLSLHDDPRPIELSVVRTSDIPPFAHPVRCQFHFSSRWAPVYAAQLPHDTSCFLLNEDFEDRDMTCHMRLARQSGIALLGPDPDTVFPEISDSDFFSSLIYDAQDMDFSDPHAQYYYSDVLILARILSFAQTRRILSKARAGRWAQEQFPQYASLLRAAELGYTRQGSSVLDETLLNSYKNNLVEMIQKIGTLC